MKAIFVKHKTKTSTYIIILKRSPEILVSCLKMFLSLKKTLWVLCIFILYFFYLFFLDKNEIYRRIVYKNVNEPMI